MALDRDSVSEALREAGTIAAASRLLGCDRRRLSEFVNADPELVALRAAPAERAAGSATVREDTAEVTVAGSALGDHAALLTARGLDPAEWYVVEVKAWQTYHGEDRLTVLFRRTVALSIVSPARHVPALLRPIAVGRPEGQPELIVVEGDHQAPYFDPALDAAATAMVADLQPDRHVFLGDLMDFPTISRHADHPAAMATVKECLEAGYGILRRRAEAAPNARREFLKGNHDWRLESELLSRAERMSNITPVGEDIPALSLRRLLHLDALGVELVEDVRGWEHAEVDLVPGRKGLGVRHGWLTGANVAKRSMEKRGRSLLVGHGHGREHHFAWDPSAGVERQAAMLGAMCLVRGEVPASVNGAKGAFPNFATVDTWLQGFATVTVWPNGAFLIEHGRWDRGTLYWRDRRWTP